ncbi:MAG: FHA domain-containing protein [Armatimonadota bacterium]
MSDNDRIEIDFDNEPEPAPVAPSRPADDRLVITADDLLAIPDEPAAPTVLPGLPLGAAYPGTPGAPYPLPAKAAPMAQMLGSVLWQMVLAGAIGGFIAWLGIEPFTNDEEEFGRSIGSMLIEMGLFGGVIGGGIGLCLGAVEGLAGRVYEKAAIGGLLGLAIGFGGGFLGGIIGQIIYGVLGGGGGSNLIMQVIARTLGWGAIGLCVGLGQGIAIRSTRKILNGLLGGLIGGAVGGLLFDVIGMFLGGGEASRAIAITVLGACAGAAIGMVEELAKQAWLRVVQGPLAGKEFILYHTVTTVGSSPKCEITIPKDPSILPQHCAIRNTGRGYSLDSVDERSPAVVNGRPVRQSDLRDGDQVQLGHTVVLYSERAAKHAAGPSYPPQGRY